jgi:hypothetical protein
MKRIQAAGLILAAFLALGATTAPKKDVPPLHKTIKGADWLLMTTKEKEAFLNSEMDFIERKGIPLQRPMQYYGAAINEVLMQPGTDKAEVTTILLSIVYKDDPRTRPMIDKMKRVNGAPVAGAPAASAQQASSKSRQRLY